MQEGATHVDIVENSGLEDLKDDKSWWNYNKTKLKYIEIEKNYRSILKFSQTSFGSIQDCRNNSKHMIPNINKKINLENE